MPKGKSRATYYDAFKGYDSLPYEDNNPAEDEVVYAGYTFETYSGYALIVFRRDGKWFENTDAHCSCYGLDCWEPEETTREALLMRQGWPGLHEAVGRVAEGSDA